MDQSAEGQLRAIRKVIAVTQSAGIPVWLFGGRGLDARIGRITREHGDVEFWLFPPGSFGDEPGTLDGMPVPVMSVSGMLAMKEQFPHLRNGRPWRQKDVDDIEILRGLAAEGRAGK